MNLCVGSYRIFSVFSFFVFLSLPTCEPTHTYPHGVLFPHFLHLLFLPLLHSLNSTFNIFSYSCLHVLSSGFHPLVLQLQFILYHDCFLQCLSHSFSFYLPSNFFPPPLQTVHSLSGSFSWRVERLLDWYVEGSSQQQDLALQLHGALENSTVRH